MRSLKDLHPITQAVYFAAVLFAAMFCSDPVMHLLSLAGGAAFFLTLKRSPRTHLYFWGLFALTALLNPLVSHKGATVLFFMNDSPVTLEAVLYGLSSSCMLVGALYFFACFSGIMTSDRLLYLMSFLSPKLALVFSTALRYVPLLTRQAGKINSAQKALGLYKNGNIPDSIRGGLRVFSALTTWALENGIITADSMAARGYGCRKRTFYSIYRFRARDAAVTAFSLIAGGISLWGTAAGAVGFEFYPNFVPPALFPALAVYFVFGALSFLPFFLETAEVCKWKYLTSRI